MCLDGTIMRGNRADHPDALNAGPSLSPAKTCESLHDAARAGNADAVKAFLDSGADIHAKDGFGYTPLHVARNAEVVQLLVELGADVNAKNVEGWTPLQIAKMNLRTRVVEFLRDHGAKE